VWAENFQSICIFRVCVQKKETARVLEAKVPDFHIGSHPVRIWIPDGRSRSFLAPGPPILG